MIAVDLPAWQMPRGLNVRFYCLAMSMPETSWPIITVNRWQSSR